RDRNVTGVQTCALPILKKKIKYTLALIASISCVALLSFASYLQIHEHIYKGLFWNVLLILFLLFSSSIYLKQLIKGPNDNQDDRSEERRVGKECRLSE